MGKSAKNKRKAATGGASAAAEPAAPKKTRPERTPQNPFEQAEETLYSVDEIRGMRWKKGDREYLVRWGTLRATGI